MKLIARCWPVKPDHSAQSWDQATAGDVWVEGSRAFRAFDDFLLPPTAFAAKRQAGELGGEGRAGDQQP
jgi:hypothetical protein